MSRALFVALDEAQVRAKCLAHDVAISVIERLPGGGVRLVCMSSDGAAEITQKLRPHLIAGDVTRTRHRPVTPLW